MHKLGKILLLCGNDPLSRQAVDLAKGLLGNRAVCLDGRLGSPFPEDAAWECADLAVSFRCPWNVPDYAIDRFGGLIQFEAGTRDHPGIEGARFAIVDEASHFGAYCYHLAKPRTEGGLIEERLFRIGSRETFESLRRRAEIVLLSLFHDVMTNIGFTDQVPPSKPSACRPAFSDAEIEDLMTIGADMSEEEVKRRVAAAPGQAFVTFGAERFVHQVR